MPRHIPRSHLRHPIDGNVGPACGSSSDRVLSRSQFLKASDRCQHCDRIAQGLKANTGGRGKDNGLKYAIVLSHLTTKALERIQRLAAEGKAGKTLGLLFNKDTEQLGE